MLEQTYEKLREFISKRYKSKVERTTEELDFVLDEVGTYIRNYCAITQIPVVTPGIQDRPGGLFYVWAGLAVDILRYWDFQDTQDQSADGDYDIDPSDLAEIKLGDTVIRRGGQLGSTRTNMVNQQHIPNLDALVYNYQHSLNQFRQMRW